MLDIQLHCRPVRKDVLLMPNPACCWFGSLQATLFFFFGVPGTCSFCLLLLALP